MNSEAGTSGPLILILEKDFIVGLDLLVELRKRGYRTEFFSSLEEVKQVMHALHPSLIIADSYHWERLVSSTPEVYCEEEGLVILDKHLKEIGYFNKPFFSKSIVNFLSETLKALGQ